MKKIKNRILLGVVSGLLGAIPSNILNAVEYNLGLTDRKYEQMAASIFTTQKDSSIGQLVGALANESLNATG
ncbi:MAG: hypothetical protein AB1420_05915 [Bacillota bacterium]